MKRRTTKARKPRLTNHLPAAVLDALVGSEAKLRERVNALEREDASAVRREDLDRASDASRTSAVEEARAGERRVTGLCDTLDRTLDGLRRRLSRIEERLGPDIEFNVRPPAWWEGYNARSLGTHRPANPYLPKHPGTLLSAEAHDWWAGWDAARLASSAYGSDAAGFPRCRCIPEPVVKWSVPNPKDAIGRVAELSPSERAYLGADVGRGDDATVAVAMHGGNVVGRTVVRAGTLSEPSVTPSEARALRLSAELAEECGRFMGREDMDDTARELHAIQDRVASRATARARPDLLRPRP